MPVCSRAVPLLSELHARRGVVCRATHLGHTRSYFISPAVRAPCGKNRMGVSPVPGERREDHRGVPLPPPSPHARPWVSKGCDHLR